MARRILMIGIAFSLCSGILPAYAGGLSVGSVDVTGGMSAQPVNTTTANSLIGKGYSNLSVDGDSTSDAWKISYKHPISGAWKGEIGYVDLGNTDLDVSLGGTPAGRTPDQIAQDIVDSTEKKGQGVVAGIYYEQPITKKLSTQYGVGAYVWEDKHDIEIGGTKYEKSDDGVSPYLATSIGYKLNNKAAIIFDTERYFMSGEDASRLGLGMRYQF